MKIDLSNLSTGQEASGHLAIKECTVRDASNQTNFLDLRLTDGTVEIYGKVWDHTGQAPIRNSVIAIKAVVSQYKGQNQLTIQEWSQAREGEYNPSDFLPVCPHDTQKMLLYLRKQINNIKDPGLKELVEKVFEVVEKDFIMAPAAEYHHHACLGGLLWHTTGVVDQCRRQATPDINMDILLAGAVLHDVGKIYDYDWSGCVLGMTDNGKLLGHITQGIMLINSLAPSCHSLAPQRLSLLLHMIASHHGKLEWGSPVEPKTKEALLLHNADIMDVQLWKVNQAISQAPEGESWTAKVAGINRQFYAGK